MASDPDSIDLDTLRAVTTAATAVFTAAPRRAAAISYLRQRGIDTRNLDGWPLGYAPPGWTRLAQTLHRDFGEDELIGAGVAVRSSRGSLIDTFRNRVIFPIHHTDGQVAGFVGRDLSGDPNAPKYLNTRRTRLFAKSELLYGLHEGRASGQPVLVEGPVDVLAIAARSGGLRPVAACGTALTLAHSHAIAATGNCKIVVALDADSAGRVAALRAGHTLRAIGLDVHLAVLPAGLDPADYLAQPGSTINAFTHAAALPLLTAQVRQRIADQGDRMRWIEGRLAAARAISTDLRTYPISTAATQIGWIADALGLDTATFTYELACAFQRPADLGMSQTRDRAPSYAER